METTVGLYGKGNEIIFWQQLYVGSCLVLSDNCCCMHYRHRNTLQQICMSRIDNDNVRQGLKIVSSDNNIHPFPNMVGKKVGNLFLYVSSILRRDICNNILKHIMGYNVLTLAWAM